MPLSLLKPSVADRPVGARALELVHVADRSLDQVAADLALERDELRLVLAEARTALRRARKPLAGGGRCLRARRLLSDSLDEGLDEGEAALLRVHLANCLRCVEHEELLNEELEALAAPAPAPTPAPVDLATPVLRVVEPGAVVVPLPPRRQTPAQPRDLSRLRRVAIAAAITLLAGGLAVGVTQVAGELDSAPTTIEQQAPWARPGAPVIPPLRPE